MREKTLKKLFDNIFWYAVYLLPVISFSFVLFRTGSVTSFETVFDGLGFLINSSNPFYVALDSMFGVNGVLPMFTVGSTALFSIVSYFGTCWLFHIAIDVLLFIPRLAHSWIESFNSKIGGNS